MNETLVTIVGNVASAVSYAQTASGVPVANFRMATTERRFDRGAGDWVDGDTTWVTVVAWRWLATNLVSSVNKGDPVVVSGRLRVREWGEEGKRRTTVEVDARSVGHDLARGTSAFRWAVRGRDEQSPHVRGVSAAPDGLDRGGRPVSVDEAVPDWIVAAVGARWGEGARPAPDPEAGSAVSPSVARSAPGGAAARPVSAGAG